MGDSDHRKVGRRAGIVGFFTFCSRILGLIRDSVVAYFFGASATADAFYVAFRIPNLLRRLTAEGALTIAFVPVFTEYVKQSREEGKVVAGVVLTYLSLLLVILVSGGILFAPYIVKAMAYGFFDDPEKFRLTVYLTRIMFPYILFISLTALAMGILNSLKTFASPALSPVLLNVFIILGAAVLSRFFHEPTVGLAFGVLLGGLSQIVLQIPSLAKRGMLPRLNFNYHHPGLKKLLFLMLPAAFGAAVYQVNVLVVTFLASFLPDGSVSYLWYADRVAEFPLGIFAVAIATATLPTLSDHMAENNLESFKKTFRFGLRGSFAVTMPASIGLMVLSLPIVRLLFERGVFSRADSVGAAGALFFFALGLPFLSGVRNVVPAYYAMKDSKTPVIISTVVVVCNAVLAVILLKLLSYRGLALAMALANLVNLVLLLVGLKRKIGRLGGHEIAVSFLRVSLSSALMGGVVWLVRHYVIEPFFWDHWSRLAMGVTLAVAAGILVYVLFLKMIRAPEYQFFSKLLRSRRAQIS